MSDVKCPKAVLSWRGVEYLFDSLACYEQGKAILLPDNTIIDATGWYESWPPKPSGLRQLPESVNYIGRQLTLARRLIPHVTVCGHSRSGKDEVAKIIRKLTPLRYSGSLSWHAVPYMAERLGVSGQEAWENRHANSALWTQYLDEYRQDDETKLVRQALAGNHHLVVGIRSAIELMHCRVANLFDHVVWVNRPGVPADPTMTFGPDGCDAVIDNNGTLEDLESAVRQWLVERGIPLRGI